MTKKKKEPDYDVFLRYMHKTYEGHQIANAMQEVFKLPQIKSFVLALTRSYPARTMQVEETLELALHPKQEGVNPLPEPPETHDRICEDCRFYPATTTLMQNGRPMWLCYEDYQKRQGAGGKLPDVTPPAEEPHVERDPETGEPVGN